MKYDLVVLDVGNSNVDQGFYVKDELVSVVKSPTKTYRGKNLIEAQKIIAISVAGQKIEDKLSLNKQIQFLSKEDIPVQAPLNLGVDRRLNLFAAHRLYQSKSVLVIDMGTALTFTYSEDYCFEGGVIFSGVGIANICLSKKTSALSLIEDIHQPDKVLQTDTNKAIQSGMFYFYKYAVENMINKIKLETNKSPLVILTGGDSFNFFESLEGLNIFNPNLKLMGLKLISEGL